MSNCSVGGLWPEPPPKRVKPWPGELPGELKKMGLDLAAPFNTKWYNDSIAEDHLMMKPLPHFGRPDGALAFIVGSSRNVWQHFLRYSPRTAFPDLPKACVGICAFDQFVEDAMYIAVERAKTDPKMGRTYAFAHAMENDYAFQRAAAIAAMTDLDPLTNLCIHPIYGAWVSMRAIVIFDCDPPTMHPRPVTATLTDGEIDRCNAVLQKIEAAGPDDWEDCLKLRESIKRGKDYKFSENHIMYFFQGPNRCRALKRAIEYQVV